MSFQQTAPLNGGFEILVVIDLDSFSEFLEVFFLSFIF